MDKTLNFSENMACKGAKMVDTIFERQFNHIPEDDMQINSSAAVIADMMLLAYLEGVKATLTDKEQYIELDGFIKAIFK